MSKLSVNLYQCARRDRGMRHEFLRRQAPPLQVVVLIVRLSYRPGGGRLHSGAYMYRMRDQGEG